MRLIRRVSLGTFLVIAVLYALISFLIVQDLTGAERMAQQDHPGNYGRSAEDVEFMPRDMELRLSGWYLQGEPDAPHLIFVHGLNSVRSGDQALELADRLVARGYNIVMFDLRGHGSSQDGRTSAGYFERQDVWGTYDYLTEHRGVAPDQVGLIGFSMGAATAILAAAAEPDIRAVVADSPFAVAAELIAQETSQSTPLPGWATPAFIPAVSLLANWLYDIDIGAIAPEQAVAHLDYTVLVIHGDADTRIPVSHGERVTEAGPPGTRLWRVAGAGHVAALATSPDEYAERLAAYLDTRFK